MLLQEEKLGGPEEGKRKGEESEESEESKEERWSRREVEEKGILRFAYRLVLPEMVWLTIRRENEH